MSPPAGAAHAHGSHRKPAHRRRRRSLLRWAARGALLGVALVLALVAFSLVAGLGVVLAGVAGLATILSGAAPPAWAVYALLVALLLVACFGAVANLIVLFTVFTQSQGFSLSGLDRGPGREER